MPVAVAGRPLGTTRTSINNWFISWFYSTPECLHYDPTRLSWCKKSCGCAMPCSVFNNNRFLTLFPPTAVSNALAACPVFRVVGPSCVLQAKTQTDPRELRVRGWPINIYIYIYICQKVDGYEIRAIQCAHAHILKKIRLLVDYSNNYLAHL